MATAQQDYENEKRKIANEVVKNFSETPMGKFLLAFVALFSIMMFFKWKESQMLFEVIQRQTTTLGKLAESVDRLRAEIERGGFRYKRRGQ